MVLPFWRPVSTELRVSALSTWSVGDFARELTKNGWVYGWSALLPLLDGPTNPMNYVLEQIDHRFYPRRKEDRQLQSQMSSGNRIDIREDGGLWAMDPNLQGQVGLCLGFSSAPQLLTSMEAPTAVPPQTLSRVCGKYAAQCRQAKVTHSFVLHKLLFKCNKITFATFAVYKLISPCCRHNLCDLTPIIGQLRTGVLPLI